MSNESFQIIITVATVVAFLAMLAQAVIFLALFRSAQKMKAGFAPFLVRARSVFSIEDTTVRRLETVIDKAAPCFDAFECMPAKLDVLATRVRSLGGGSGQVTTRLLELQRSAAQTESSARRLIHEMTPRVHNLKEETSTLLRSARAQGVRVGGVFRDLVTHAIHLWQFMPHR